MTEEQLAVAYQTKGDIAALAQLRVRVAPMMKATVDRYMTGPGHTSRFVMETKADELLVDAAKSFKPNAGAAFKTHLFNHLRRLDRFTKANANIAYKPESRANMLSNFNNQYAILTESKQRPPTEAEIADHMSIPLPVVQRMLKTQKREVPWSQVQGVSHQGMEDAKVTMILDDVSYRLTPDEKLVFDHITGRNGKKKVVSGGELAKVTGFSQAKVSTIRKRIAMLIQPMLGSTVQVPQ